MNLCTGESEEREFDSLVLATTNTPEDRLTKELAGAGLGSARHRRHRRRPLGLDGVLRGHESWRRLAL